MNEHYNPNISPYMKTIDDDNGSGYSENIAKKGNFIKTQSGGATMFYEVKNITDNTPQGETIRVVCIHYIHYDSKKELYSLLAFACQWWKNLKPRLIYYREKERKKDVGKYLKELGFKPNKLENNLKPFNCLIDGGHPCTCRINEYCGYRFN